MLAVSQIVRHAPFDIPPFTVEIFLGFQHRTADQSVQPPVHLRHALLEIQLVQLCAELFDQQLAEVRLHLIMAGAAGQVT